MLTENQGELVTKEMAKAKKTCSRCKISQLPTNLRQENKFSISINCPY